MAKPIVDDTSEKIRTIKERLNSTSGPLMEHHVSSLVGVRADELKALALSNPEHSCSQVFLKAIATHRPTDLVYVDETDLHSIIENRVVVIKRSIKPPFEELTKALGDKLLTQSNISIIGEEAEPEDVDSGGTVSADE